MNRSTASSQATAAAQNATSFTVGNINCSVISDGVAPYPPDFLFANATGPDLSAALDDRLDEQGLLPTPYHCLLLQTPTSTVLVDTGLGLLADVDGAPAGQLLATLAAHGIDPADIDEVLLSHAHPDHIGGLVREESLVFPNARHVMSRTEWEFWTNPDCLARLPEFLAAPARAILPPLAAADALDLVDGDCEILPGIRLRPAPGHTPGHCVVTISAADQETTFLADAVLDDLNFTHPDWVSAVDFDPEETRRTRTRLLEEAAAAGSPVLAYHMRGIGHVEQADRGFSFLRQ